MADNVSIARRFYEIFNERAFDDIANYVTDESELVVVGTHGRTGLVRLTLGSTAEQVLERAPCSVLVVRLAA